MKRAKSWKAAVTVLSVASALATGIWVAACSSQSFMDASAAPRPSSTPQAGSAPTTNVPPPMQRNPGMQPITAAPNSLGIDGFSGGYIYSRGAQNAADVDARILGESIAPPKTSASGVNYDGAPEFNLDGAMRGGRFDPATRWYSWQVVPGDSNGDGGLDDRIDASRMAAANGRTPELLIIERTRERVWAANNALGCGGMVATWKDHEVTVPLKHTDVKASVYGYISTVNVTQQFNNPYDSKIEAVYVFPLPENAAVSDFLMTIGDRTIRGIIREREQAEQIYAAARAQGYTASLMTQERPNIFTQKVANIEPGKEIDINIKYYSTLTYSDGGYEFFFPMVIGPRFNPPGETEGVGAVAKGAAGASGQATEVQYLRPDQRSGHDISLSVDIDAGVSIEDISCKDHAVSIQRPTPTTARVRLSDRDNIPNRDFVLRYNVAGDYVKSALLTHEDARGGFFTMMLVPPKDLAKVQRGAVEMVFVLDCSGSMSGVPIDQAKAAIARGLKRLEPGDTFQIIDFAETATALGAVPLDANPLNIQRGLSYLNGLNANGGTMMMNGLRASLEFPHDSERLRFVTFCTDGFIGNESEILGAEHERLGASRIFSFGVGNCNRYLLDSMARMGSGVAAYLGNQDDAGAVMDTYFDRISHPALCNLTADWGGANVSEVYPSRLPDLFVGRPVIITGRYSGHMPSSVRVSGRMGRQIKTIDVPVTRAEGEDVNAALPQVWARTKLAELGDIATWNGEAQRDLAGTTKQTSLEYCLLSPYTAFIAVDSTARTAGTYGTTVQVPVPVPEGVRYENTVTGK